MVEEYAHRTNKLAHTRKQDIWSAYKSKRAVSTQQNDLAKDQHTRSPHHPRKKDCEKEA